MTESLAEVPPSERGDVAGGVGSAFKGRPTRMCPGVSEHLSSIERSRVQRGEGMVIEDSLHFREDGIELITAEPMRAESYGEEPSSASLLPPRFLQSEGSELGCATIQSSDR